MKKTIEYEVNQKKVQREINYIPVRYIFAVLITLLEVLAILAIVVVLCYYVPYFYVAAWLTEIFCVINIISSDDNPDYKVPWLLFVLILPIAGFMLYFLFYSRKLSKRYLRRLKELKTQDYKKDDTELFSRLATENATAAASAKMLCEIADTHLFTNTRQTYFPLGEDMHAAMLCDLERAERFIFLEYFIIEEGKLWSSILAILQKKAQEGVTVRVVFDDIGCMSTLPGNYAKILRKSGIEATPFSRLRGNADGEFNNRSHRKILVIDGKIGYTGGVNLADEYINEKPRFGHWKDTAIRLEGEAVWELTRLFCADFGVNVKHLPEPPKDLYPTAHIREDGYLIPFGDGPRPLYQRRVAKSVIENMLYTATRYVYITTPYLIIDNALCAALENAALRGVDVRVTVPHIPDKKLVFAVTRSFYKRLIEAGVRIYEYTPGFVHAKCYIADDKYAVIGTVNLDYRSLVHHFENGVWLYGCASIADMKEDMNATLAASAEVTRADLTKNIFVRFLRAFARIFAPML